MINNIMRLARPKHWIKNMFVLFPAFFGGGFKNTDDLAESLIAFLAFSFTASSIYCYNDILDIDDDRRHNEKCHRPIASGAVTVTQGYFLMLLLACLGIGTTLLLPSDSKGLLLVIVSYFVMEIAYCRWLKRIAVVDVVVLSFGFVLRILAGSAATGILASHWLVLMTFLLALLLAFAKRRDDVLRLMKTGEAPRHNTRRYNLMFVNQAITVTASVTLVCYIMYTISPEVTLRTNFRYGYLTTIFVLLGLLRYMQLTSVDGKSGDPTKLFYSDHFLQVVVGLWLASYFVIIYILDKR